MPRKEELERHSFREPGSAGPRPAFGLPCRSDTAGLPAGSRDSLASASLDRRTLIKLMAASAALSTGGLGCKRKPYRKIVNLADSPEYQHPGRPLFYASTWTEGQAPYGMMVKCVDGRPVKIEGLKTHPLNRGASNAQMQASILSLYDPDRLRGPRKGADPVAWEKADQEIAAALKTARTAVLMTRSLLGPSERAQIGRFLKACPVARHFVYETVHGGERRSVWKRVFGADGEARPLLAGAGIILSLDSDFLGTDGASIPNSREFADSRALALKAGDASKMPRLYAAESVLTVTGSNADHRISLRPSAMAPLAVALLAALRGNDEPLKSFAGEHSADERLLLALAADLKSHAGEAVVLAGPHLPEPVHAAAALINAAIGAHEKTLEWNPAPATLPVNSQEEIAAALNEGPDLLLLLSVNPVFDWPGGGFEDLLGKAKLSVGHGPLLDETLSRCSFALPSTHNLESWNDASPLPGLFTLCQPMIAPLYDARQEAESLLKWTQGLLSGDEEMAAFEDWHGFLKSHWKREILADPSDSDESWHEALRTGMAGRPQRPPFPEMNTAVAEQLAQPAAPPDKAGPWELVIRPHYALLDGRFSHNAWLQELPDPLTKLVWDNALAVNPKTAERLGLEEGDLVRVGVEGGARSLVLPLLVAPGVAHGAAAVTLGHGRTAGRFVATGCGFNAAVLLKPASAAGASRAETAWMRVAGVSITAAAGKHTLVRTQEYFDMQGRPIVLQGTREEYEKNPAFVKERLHAPPLKQLHAEWDYSQGHKWIMAADLSRCTGCGSCVIACQAENNVPAVGKEECRLGREMAWMRIDCYLDGDPANPTVYRQPMLCQHCDNAPCESVCPVNASSHSAEGLNEQTYNRCVGTRYCANNCPYKVRRFNFFHYTKEGLKDPIQELRHNPQVTVRSRGVMEKCTFCVQRINEAKFQAKNECKPIPDGAIVPACAQACPSRALVFGDENDPLSQVKALKASPLAYFVLEELNVRPNVAYLARVRNSLPDLSGGGPRREHG